LTAKRRSAPPRKARRARPKTTDLHLRVEPGSEVRITLEELRSDKTGRPRLLHQSRVEIGSARPELPPPRYEFLPDEPEPASRPSPRGEGHMARIFVGLRRIGYALFGWAAPFDLALFAVSLVVYFATRLADLASYPIYFFTDEAVQTVLAQDFLRGGLHDFAGRLFPTYFLNIYEFNLNFSVYAQILPLLAFGKSLFVTRATSAILSGLAAGAIAYVVGRFFRVRYWWTAVLFLGLTPAWFLHSRTAFETTLMAAFYGLFLAAYLLYRMVHPRYLYLSLLFGALVFYTYGPGQIISLATAVLLFAVDFRHHWQNRRTLAPGLVWAAVLMLPYLRFQFEQPGLHQDFLRLLDSYWLRDLSLSQKLATALGNYLQALSPGYWFGVDSIDLPRHLMGSYGNLSRWAVPFTAVGMVLCARRLRTPAPRLLWVAILAIPFGAVVVGVGITRVLSFAIPIAAFSALGLTWIAERFFRRIPYRHAAVMVVTSLSAMQVGMLADALGNGPTWNTEYGLYGMQFGARQVFGLAQDYIEDHPGDRVFLSSSWANGTDLLARFFVGDDSPISISGVAPWREDRLELNDHMAFLLTADEIADVERDPKFLRPTEIDRILLPDGRLGFAFVHLGYSPEADSIISEETRLRQIPVVGTVLIDGQLVSVEHPLLDSGDLPLLFDGDEYTLIRTYEANPARFVFTFESPRPIRRLNLTAGAFSLELTLRLTSPEGETVTYFGSFTLPAEQPTIDMAIDRGPETTARLEMEILHLYTAGRVKIHLRELRLLDAN
jgi:hypothetical protein